MSCDDPRDFHDPREPFIAEPDWAEYQRWLDGELEREEQERKEQQRVTATSA